MSGDMKEPDLQSLKKPAGALAPEIRARLLNSQTVQKCRAPVEGSPGSFLPCGSNKQYHGHRPHEFVGTLTCESCRHMGGVSWPGAFGDRHYCAKEKERRHENFRSCGDSSTDFMNEFCKFYDASPTQWAENCSFFEPREIEAPAASERLS